MFEKLLDITALALVPFVPFLLPLFHVLHCCDLPLDVPVLWCQWKAGQLSPGSSCLWAMRYWGSVLIFTGLSFLFHKMRKSLILILGGWSVCGLVAGDFLFNATWNSGHWCCRWCRDARCRPGQGGSWPFMPLSSCLGLLDQQTVEESPLTQEG